MSRTIKRREFIRTGALAGAAVLAGGLRGQGRERAELPRVSRPDMAVVTGADRIAAVAKGLDAFGGMKAFVKPGSTVGLLVNAPPGWRLPGSHTHPDLALAVIVAALEAGAKSLHYVKDPQPNYWKRAPLAAKYEKEIGAVQKCSGVYVETTLAKAKAVKKIDPVKELLDCDVFVNLPIIKNHIGVGMTGCLKNMMGANGPTNGFFHFGSNAKGGYNDVPFLSQCIADLNTVRKPDLCVADATEFLLTNGPAGPGELRRLDKVILGTDAVAVDAYGATLLDLKAADVLMIVKSAELGLGRMDVDKLVVEQLAV